MKRSTIIMSAVLVSAWVAGTVCAATITTAANGNWTNTATWTGGTIPGLDDQASITYGKTVELDSAATVGNVYMAGKTTLNVGGNLTVDNSGSQNGQILIDNKNDPGSINIFGFSQLNPKGALKVNAGNAGVTNMVSVSYGGLIMGGWTYWGEDGAGEAMLEIGQNANVKMWGKENYMLANSIVRFEFNPDGVSSALEINKSDGFLNLAAGADLVIDMSAMGLEDVGAVGSEITLIDVIGTSAFVTGTWDNVSFLGDSAVTSKYELNYDAGDGRDVTLTVIPEPATLGLFFSAGIAVLLTRRLRL